MDIATPKKIANTLIPVSLPGAVRVLVAVAVDELQVFVVIDDQSPERRLLRIALGVYGRGSLHDEQTLAIAMPEDEPAR